MGVAKCVVEKNVDCDGVEKHFINHYVGEKVSYHDSPAVCVIFCTCIHYMLIVSTNVYERLMYGVLS